jgi:SAM-dependent methyltransferase
MNEFQEGKDRPHSGQPDEFFRNFITGIEPGRILLPSDGIGENAVFAAELGWEVDTFDFSLDTRKKAIYLARKEGVSPGYATGNLEFHELEEDMYDVVALIFVNIKMHNRAFIHKKLVTSLKSGGFFLVEAVTCGDREGRNLDDNNGSCYDIDDLKADFSTLDIETLHKEIPSPEGAHFHGRSGVLRMIAIKP